MSFSPAALTTLDLPAFLRPKKPMCTLSAEGVSFKLMCIPPCPMSGLSSRLLAFGKGGSLRKSRVETSKSFVHLFKGGRVWDRVPRSRGCKGRRSRLPARSALDGAHRAPAPLPSPTPKKGRRMSPSWGGTEPGGLLVEGAGWVPPRPLPGLSPAFSPAGSVSAERCPPGTSAVRPVRCFSSTGCAG